MPNYTSNANLYKWNVNDTKQLTIDEMASNSEKIDAKLHEQASQLAETVKLKYEPTVLTGRNYSKDRGVPLFTIIDDDARIETYNIMRAIAIEKGIKFGSCVMVSEFLQGTPRMMTKDQLLTLQSDGHEIMSHGMTHQMTTTLPRDTWDWELRNSKEELRKQGFDVTNYVYPGGDYNDDLLNFIKPYYDSCWSIDNQINKETFNNHRATRYDFDPVGSLNAFKTYVDNIYANGGWLCLMIHTHFTQWATIEKQQELKDLIDYVKSKSIQIVTPKEGLQYYGNVVDVGDTKQGYLKVNNRGVILNDHNRYLSYKQNTITPQHKPSFFYGISEGITVNNGASTIKDFPTEVGTLKITKGFDESVIQMWYPWTATTSVGYYYIRESTTTSAWSVWKKVSMYGNEKIAITKVFPTINAGASVQVTIDISSYGINKQTPIIVNFENPMPNGLIWSSYHDGINLIFNLYNAAATAVTGTTMYINAAAVRSV